MEQLGPQGQVGIPRRSVQMLLDDGTRPTRFQRRTLYHNSMVCINLNVDSGMVLASETLPLLHADAGAIPLKACGVDNHP